MTALTETTLVDVVMADQILLPLEPSRKRVLSEASKEKRRERCRKYRRENRAKWREKSITWNEQNPDAYQAHKAVERAIRRGLLIPQLCACGEKAHAHHDDYSKQLDVIWLCPQHHKDRHRIIDPIRNSGAITRNEDFVSLEGEIWQRSTIFPNYELSTYGRIRYAYRKGNISRYRLRKPEAKKGGIFRYGLMKDGKLLHIYAGRLFCTEFHGSAPSEDCFAAYKDGNRANNQIDNLEWRTR